jgi:hypothetical protein
MALGDLPKIEFRDYPLKVAVWQQDKHEAESGRDWTESSFSVSKTFKKKDGSGYDQRSLTLFPDDLLRLIALLQQAYACVCVKTEVPKPKERR